MKPGCPPIPGSARPGQRPSNGCPGRRRGAVRADVPARIPRWDWGPPGPPAPAPAPDQDGPAGAAPAALPGPEEPVSFGAHIKPLFRSRDRQAMSFAFDLWSADEVRANAGEILARLANGSMPCDGTWSPAQIDVFRRWTQTGTQP